MWTEWLNNAYIYYRAFIVQTDLFSHISDIHNNVTCDFICEPGEGTHKHWICGFLCLDLLLFLFTPFGELIPLLPTTLMPNQSLKKIHRLYFQDWTVTLLTWHLHFVDQVCVYVRAWGVNSLPSTELKHRFFWSRELLCL